MFLRIAYIYMYLGDYFLKDREPSWVDYLLLLVQLYEYDEAFGNTNVLLDSSKI